MELSRQTKCDRFRRMVKIVEQLHQQRLSGRTSACKRNYRRYIERNHAEFIVCEQFLEIVRYLFGFWISVNHHTTFAGRDFGEWLGLRSTTPGGTDQHEAAVLGELLQQFALGCSWRIEFNSNDRAEFRHYSGVEPGTRQ